MTSSNSHHSWDGSDSNSKDSGITSELLLKDWKVSDLVDHARASSEEFQCSAEVDMV